MNRTDDRLMSIEVSIDSLVESVDKTADYLKIISREMIISNLPKELHKDQRKLFSVADDLSIQQYMVKIYKSNLRSAKDDVSADGFKFDIEQKEKRIKELYADIGQLVNKGCVMV
jgi:cell division FtsZ-interacting protein ZapD